MRQSPRHSADCKYPWRVLHVVARQLLPGYSFLGLVPLPASVPGWPRVLEGATAGTLPKRRLEAFQAATGEGVGQAYERGSGGLLAALPARIDRPTDRRSAVTGRPPLRP